MATEAQTQNPQADQVHRGSCMCGAVQLEASGEPAA